MDARDADSSDAALNIHFLRLKKSAKIAAEEAMIPEITDEVRKLARKGGMSLYLKLLATVFDAPPLSPEQSKASINPTNRDAGIRVLLPKLLDVGEMRIAKMDANRVEMHLLRSVFPAANVRKRYGGFDGAAL